MKAASLSIKLGWKITFFASLLLVLLGALAFIALTRELDKLAKDTLEKKLDQIEISLSRYENPSQVSLNSHALTDQIIGHEELGLAAYDLTYSNTPVFRFGAGLPDTQSELKNAKAADDKISYASISTQNGQRFLTAYKLIRLRQGIGIPVLLSMDYARNEALLKAYILSKITALPFIILLIAGCVWMLVKRGLAPLSEFRKIVAMTSSQDRSHRLSTAQMPQEFSELAQGINFMLHRLDGDIQHLSQFSDDLAYELRTPLTSLMSKAQAALSEERTADEYKALLGSCTEELARVVAIISDMLLIAQVNHPNGHIPFEPISLEDEAQKVIDLFSLVAEDKSITLNLVGNGKISGDRSLIRRALSNLLSNAILHCPDGNTIPIIIENHAAQVSLFVGYPGAGIEARHLPHVFDRFYRIHTREGDEDSGTGLGLAIVRSIMSFHHGAAEVQSMPGSMTVFRLGFPNPDAASTWKEEATG